MRKQTGEAMDKRSAEVALGNHWKQHHYGPRFWTCTVCGFSERAPNESGAVDAYRLHIEEDQCR